MGRSRRLEARAAWAHWVKNQGVLPDSSDLTGIGVEAFGVLGRKAFSGCSSLLH